MSPAPSPPSGPQTPDETSLLDALPAVEYEALRWSVRSANGLDAAALAARDAWLAADPAHRQAYAAFDAVGSAVDALPAAHRARLRSVVAIDKAAASAARAPAVATASGLRPRRRAVGVLGLAALLAGGWAAHASWQHWQAQPLLARDYGTERGQQLDTPLADGSRLQLDSATRVQLRLYRARREVRLLEGQALFDVAPDAARPFQVLAGASRITVVGTRFAVRHVAAADSGAVQIDVLEGRVQVASETPSAATPVVLTAGDRITVEHDGRLGAVARPAADSIAAWRQHRLDFEDARLDTIVTELARYGFDGLRLGDAAAGQLRVTVSIDLRRIGDFARSLPKVLPVRLTREGPADRVDLVR